ncbi:MAG: NAD(+) synthase, partial [Oscillospiraceae bacterium]
EGTCEYLNDVLSTPVSPELLPADSAGDIAQKTEDILGPYELHDYFLFHFVRYGFRPSKLYYYACAAFSGQYEPKYIKETLMLFFRRFVAGQFKRACAPDSARLTDVCLQSSVYRIPSDLDARPLLAELESIEF